MSRKDFYKSKGWKKTSKAYALSKNCICERCHRPVYVSGVTDYLPLSKRLRYVVHHIEHLNETNYKDTSIAYSYDNLELLCIDCHNEEHMPNKSTKRGLMFDEMGNLVVK